MPAGHIGLTKVMMLLKKMLLSPEGSVQALGIVLPLVPMWIATLLQLP
jgi:hypothetical protein